MYFPFIRGRQFELLALKELVSNNLIGDKIIPIVEPVKLSPTLVTTIEEFINRQKKIAIIGNPSVGTFSDDLLDAESDVKLASFVKKYNNLLKNENVINSVIIQKGAKELLDFWASDGKRKEELLVILQNRDYISIYEDCFSDTKPRYVVTLGDRVFTRKLHSTDKILLDDKFIKKERNADYSKIPEEFFSDDHLFYEEEGFVGFSDYSVIGSEYMEAGFAPYAVAIHLVYFDKDHNLRINHFVSKSNDDTSNPAHKYYEALTELNNWYTKNQSNILKTSALKTFLQHFKEETYPGLGTVKKLSLMHHIELIKNYLEE